MKMKKRNPIQTISKACNVILHAVSYLNTRQVDALCSDTLTVADIRFFTATADGTQRSLRL